MWSVIHCYSVRQDSRVVAITGKLIALMWNVGGLGQFPMINLIDENHIYASARGSFSTKLVPSCLLLHLGYDTFLSLYSNEKNNFVLEFFFYKWQLGYMIFQAVGNAQTWHWCLTTYFGFCLCDPTKRLPMALSDQKCRLSHYGACRHSGPPCSVHTPVLLSSLDSGTPESPRIWCVLPGCFQRVCFISVRSQDYTPGFLDPLTTLGMCGRTMRVPRAPCRQPVGDMDSLWWWCHSLVALLLRL